MIINTQNESNIDLDEVQYFNEKSTGAGADLNRIDIDIEIADNDSVLKSKRLTKKCYADFRSIFKPIHYLCMLFCVQKYGLKHDEFTINSNVYMIFGVFGLMISIVLCAYTLYEFKLIFETYSVVIMYMAIYIQYIIQYVNLNVLVISLRNDNFKLIITLQKIYRSLYERKDVLKNRMLLIIPCFLYTLTYLILIVTKLSLDPTWSWYRSMFIGGTLIFDLDMIYAGYILYFLAYNTGRWTQLINNDEDLEEIISELVNIFEDLLDAIRLVQKVCRLTILSHICSTFLQTLCFIEILLMWIRTQSVKNPIIASHALGVGVWITKALVVDAVVCFCAENLYRTLEMARQATINQFNSRSSKVRRYSKNLLRVSDTRIGKISACGVFVVDATLPLRMASSVATYTVVLLQFAFLEN